MIRSDIVRAASRQAEVNYKGALHKYRESSAHESSCAAALRDAQREFWRELTTARRSDQRSPNKPEIAFRGDRLQRRLIEMEKAKHLYAVAKQASLDKREQLSRCSQRSDKIHEWLLKARRRHLHTVESRRAEFIQELFSARESVLNTSVAVTPKRREPISHELSESGSSGEMANLGPSAISSVEPRAAMGFGEPGALAVSRQPSASICGEAWSKLELQSELGKSKGLVVQASIGSMGTMQLRVQRAEAGAVHVQLDPATAVMARELDRERSRIVTRVLAQGVRVSSFEIGNSHEGIADAYRAPRRRSPAFESDDESNLT